MAFALWFVLCVTTGSTVTWPAATARRRVGAFLDPLADKVLVLGAMFTLVSRDVFWIVPVAIIAVRELAISLYRTSSGRRASACRPARSPSEDLDTAAGGRIRDRPLTAFDAKWLWNGLLWISVVLAVVSGAQYMWRAQPKRPMAQLPGT